MKLQNCVLTGVILLLTATSSWAAGPAPLTSPALLAYLFIYTCILAIAAVLVGGLWLAGPREKNHSGHHHQESRPHLNPVGPFRTEDDIDLATTAGASSRG